MLVLGTSTQPEPGLTLPLFTLATFMAFTAAVGGLTWWLTRRDDLTSGTGFFLAGRSLTFPLIAGSLLLTNLSTEQLVGLNGAAYTDGLCVMVWEVFCVVSLVLMAWFFLPRFLRHGVATVPQYLRLRYDQTTEIITNVIFLIAYAAILLPIILYSGARGMIGILDVATIVQPMAQSLGVQPGTLALWLVVALVGVLGSIYALFGGLRTVAVSDTLNGVGLFLGGFLVTGYALSYLGDGSIAGGWTTLRQSQPERFTSIGGPETSVPFSTVFTGIFLLNLFYWTTNQQIIQRTLGAKSLAEGQKGVLLTGTLKLLGPLFLVLPGMIAYAIFRDDPDLVADAAYGRLVNLVLPPAWTGFFAAAMVGAILSSFNSALNSVCTLFSLGVYRPLLAPESADVDAVRSGRWFGLAAAVFAIVTAPLLANVPSIFGYLQKMNGIYFIPIMAVVAVGMLTRRVPPIAAQTALLVGFVVIAAGYFIPLFQPWVDWLHEFHFLGIVFAGLVALMLAIGSFAPTDPPTQTADPPPIDMTPWRGAKPAGFALILAVAVIYAIWI